MSNIVYYLSKIWKWEVISGICAVIMLALALMKFVPEKEIVVIKRDINQNMQYIDSLNKSGEKLPEHINDICNYIVSYEREVEEYKQMEEKDFIAIKEFVKEFSFRSVYYNIMLEKSYRTFIDKELWIVDKNIDSLIAKKAYVIDKDENILLRCEEAWRMRDSCRQQYKDKIDKLLAKEDAKGVLKLFEEMNNAPDIYRFYKILLESTIIGRYRTEHNKVP